MKTKLLINNYYCSFIKRSLTEIFLIMIRFETAVLPPLWPLSVTRKTRFHWQWKKVMCHNSSHKVKLISASQNYFPLCVQSNNSIYQSIGIW